MVHMRYKGSKVHDIYMPFSFTANSLPHMKFNPYQVITNLFCFKHIQYDRSHVQTVGARVTQKSITGNHNTTLT